MPQYAIAQLRSLVSTLRKTCSPAPNQNECSMATPRARSACTAGAHELEKFTLPTWPCPVWSLCSSWQSAAAVVNRSAATLAMAERSFIMNSPRLTNEFRVRNNTCYRGGCGRAGIFFQPIGRPMARVRLASIAPVWRPADRFRSTPINGHYQTGPVDPFGATCGRSGLTVFCYRLSLHPTTPASKRRALPRWSKSPALPWDRWERQRRSLR